MSLKTEAVKNLRSILATAVLCLIGVSAGAQEFAYAKKLTPQQIVNELIASSKYRPKQVATLETFDMPLVLDGKPAGVAKIKAGTALNLVAVKPDGVIVELHGNQTKLPIDKTDLVARYADRKKEVDQQFEEARLALIADGQAPLVLPEPFYVPEPVVTEKIVYIDSSQPRIRVNNGNYWPYTGYYPYAAGYIYQPYYQPYCYTPNYPANPVCPPRPPFKIPTNNARQVLPPVVHPFAPARTGN